MKWNAKQRTTLFISVMSFLVVSLGYLLEAQTQSPTPAAAPVPPRPSAYPQRPPADPAVVQQGKNAFGVRCAFCHGSDARGGEGGPNLLRSELVLTDRSGEEIKPVVLHGRVELGMPRFELSDDQLNQIVAYIHSLPVSGNERGRTGPMVIPLGDVHEGEAAFSKTCASCHSSSGDLKGIGTKISDPKMLQQTWMMPGLRGGSPDVKPQPKRAKVVLSQGKQIEGLLVKIDDFTVTLRLADGETQTVTRNGASSSVVVMDPLAPHQKLLPTYSDKTIHDITAYLVTLK
jgi:mono/diheme cytochrome c family protein